MLKEAMEYFLKLAPVQPVDVNGLSYSDRPLSLVPSPTMATVSLLTLTGLVDLVRVKVDDLDPADWLIHVESHAQVALIQKETDAYGRRVKLVQAKHDDGQPFAFGRFLDREEFVIGLQSKFQQTEALLSVLKVASNLEAATVAQSEDDGISQRTTVKQGVQLKEVVTIKGRVVLQPYRTFREVEQPASEFVFRLQSKDGSVPTCALFEADGGKWELDAVLTIKKWLDAQNLTIPVIA